MYKQFFGLKSSPFELSPDPSFMFLSEKTREALGSISSAVGRRKGFVVLTGEVGTGKTLILRCLFKLWEREQVPFTYVIGPRLSTMDFLSYITYELGIKVTEPTKGALLRALYGFFLAEFEKGHTTVLVIDEAHQVPRSVLEEIRLLANFETAQQKLVQVLLVGQPELDRKLDAVELRSLKQRIAVRCQLEPLSQEELRQYIERRLELAGADLHAVTIFPAETIKAIYRYSMGIPRLVNNICDQALSAAYTRKIRVVPVDVIEDIASRFRLDPAPSLGQAGGPFRAASQMESIARGKSGYGAPDLDLAPGETSDPDVIVSALNEGRGTPTPTPVPSHPSGVPFLTDSPAPLDVIAAAGAHAASQDSRASDESISPTRWTPRELAPSERMVARAVPAPDLRTAKRHRIEREARRMQLGPLLEPLRRLSLLSVVVGIMAVALTTGLVTARLIKSVTMHQVAATLGTRPALQTDISTQPVAARSRVSLGIDLQPAAPPLAPKADSTDSESGGVPESVPLKNSAPWSRIVNRSLSKPVLHSLPSSASLEPPPQITGAQAKDLEPEKSLLGVAVNGPMSPAASGASQFQPPKLVSSPSPIYPPRAREENVQGVVVIDALVDETGKVSDMTVISGPPVLTSASMDALRTWKYEPARVDGRAIATTIRVNIDFHR